MTELSLAKLNNPCNHVVEPGVNGCRTQSTKTNNMKKVALFSLVSALMLVVGFNAAAAAKAPKAPKAFKIKAEVLDKFDTNKDGKLDETERAAMEKDADMIKKYDKNGDGKLDATEKAALAKDIQEKKAKKGA